MALPSTIPTSFVPRATASSGGRLRADFGGAFGSLAYLVLAIVFMLALGIFFYNRILASSLASKDAALAAAEANIDPTTVENFVRLRDRLSSSETLLNQHTAFSYFFSTLGNILPTSTRFTSLHFSQGDTGVAKVEGAGIARNFNTLAATSNAFAADGRIKDAIFSNISVNSNGSVSFALSATVDPKLIAFSATAGSGATSAPVATSSTPLP